MFSKHFVLIVLLLFSQTATANFWNELKKCINNPCNCGYGDVIEKWNNNAINKGPQNPLCPPWNKDSGRENGTCLLQFDYPQIFVPWYLQHCAESTTESTYFNPKIKVRYQSCNIAGCWSLSKALKWNGECVVWPTGYGLPLLRICARVANPENTNTKTPADPGYTYGVHLNAEGVQVQDQHVIGVDGQPIPYNRPKLCAYKDPSLFDIIKGDIDLMDFNPVKQPFHNTGSIHPIARIIIFFSEMATHGATGISDLLKSLFDKMKLDDMAEVFEFLSTIIEKLGDGITAALKEIGQFNRVVDNYNFGCVDLPIGPFPPPYCNPLPKSTGALQVQQICYSDGISEVQKSTNNTPCVRSSLDNNFIHNSIRVTMDNLIPLCKNNENTMQTDKCVKISNIDGYTAKSLNTLTGITIPPCSLATNDEICINTKIPLTCSVKVNGCEKGFRLVYAKKIGSITFPLQQFRDDLPDCPSGELCQVVWGVNTGEFVDIPLLFPRIQSNVDNNSLLAKATITDITGIERSFTASIHRKQQYNESGVSQDPSQICVYEDNNLIGCQTRQALPKPSVYSCSTNPSLCSDNYYSPAFIASFKTGKYSTVAALKALSVNNPDQQNHIANISGYDFSSFVTDDSFNTMPFSGQNSANPSSIFGKYKNNAAPYDAEGNTTNAIYLSDLEYINKSYIQGGKRICLSREYLTRCPLDTKNCVLTKLSNSDIVNCKDFLNKAQMYPNLNLCKSTKGCKSIDSIQGKNGGITINECQGATSKDYCYTNAKNVQICSISLNPDDRYLPSHSLGSTLSDNQYYDIHADNAQNYDKSLYALRDKTAIEHGLCVPITQPVCGAITTPSVADGNATWPETQVTNEAIGTCINGYKSAKELKRYCLSKAETQTVEFDQLESGMKCMGGCKEQVLVNENLKCYDASGAFISKQMTIKYPSTEFASTESIVCSFNNYESGMKGLDVSCAEDKSGNSVFKTKASYSISELKTKCIENILKHQDDVYKLHDVLIPQYGPQYGPFTKCSQ